MAPQLKGGQPKEIGLVSRQCRIIPIKGYLGGHLKQNRWSANTNSLEHGCATWSVAPENDSEEIADLKSAITSIAAAAGIDPRFVLATVMQESRGCVRVDTTHNAVANPGLMQSHDGTGTCNVQGVVTVPVSTIPTVSYHYFDVFQTPVFDLKVGMLTPSSSSVQRARYGR